MELRPLGRTDVSVSKLSFGTMMFGAWGNTDHDDSVRIIHARAGRRDQLRRHRRHVLRRRIGGDRRQGPQGPPRRRRPGHQVLGADGRRPQPARRLAPLDHRARSRTPCGGWAPTRSTSTRCTAPTRHRRRRDPRALTDLVRRERSAPSAPRRSPPADRRGAVDRARPRPPALPHRAAALLNAHPRRREGRAAHRAAPRHGRPRLRPALPPLALQELAAPTARPPRPPPSGWARFDLSLPDQVKLDAVDRLRHVAERRRFPDRARDRLRRHHPAGHRGLIGPRTAERLGPARRRQGRPRTRRPRPDRRDHQPEA